MADGSMNDIKARMKSVSSTMQITKAMELVASSKLRRAKEKLENSRPFYEVLRDAISKLNVDCFDGECAYCKKRDIKKTLYVVLAGDRGLAGAYNSNVFKFTKQLASLTADEALYLPIGKKALEHYKHRGLNVISDSFEYISDMGVGDCFAVSQIISNGFLNGEFDRVRFVYTKFVSMLSSSVVYEDVLPFEPDSEKKEIPEPVLESDIEEILAEIIPEYIGGVLWSCVCEACASEHGARRSSMNSANKNADEMISRLMLKYNRARQAIITQEITEIVSGAEAL